MAFIKFAVEKESEELYAHFCNKKVYAKELKFSEPINSENYYLVPDCLMKFILQRQYVKPETKVQVLNTEMGFSLLWPFSSEKSPFFDELFVNTETYERFIQPTNNPIRQLEIDLEGTNLSIDPFKKDGDKFKNAMLFFRAKRIFENIGGLNVGFILYEVQSMQKESLDNAIRTILFANDTGIFRKEKIEVIQSYLNHRHTYFLDHQLKLNRTRKRPNRKNVK